MDQLDAETLVRKDAVSYREEAVTCVKKELPQEYTELRASLRIRLFSYVDVYRGRSCEGIHYDSI